MRGSLPLPDQLPGEHTGPQATSGTDPLYNCLQCCHSHTHSHMITVDRSMVVGHVLMVHTCSFMCTNHIDMIAHTPSLFYELGSTPVIRTSIMQAEDAGCLFFFFQNFLTEAFQNFPVVRFEPGSFHSASKYLNHSATPET